MKNKILKLIFLFLLIFSLNNVNASEINPAYLEYEKLTEEEKKEIDLVPNKYIVYYEPKVETNVFRNRSTSMYSFYSATPTTYDLRSVNGTRLIPPIDNQGNLGLCWAFASNNAIESYYLKHDLGTLDLSENQPSYVSAYLGDTSFGQGNTGFNTIKYWFLGHGPVTEDHFGTYKEYQEDKSMKDYLDNGNLTFDVKDVYVFPALSSNIYTSYDVDTITSIVTNYNKDIKNHLMTNGALFAGVFWDFYDEEKNLVYNDRSKNYDDYKTSGHAVTIIGWDDNYEGATVNGEEVKGAWLAMNSWGEENVPYFYISYYDIDVVNFLFGPTQIEEKTWNNSYTYPTLIEDTTTTKIYQFNKSNTQETLNSLRILFQELETEVEITISDGYNTYTPISSTTLHYGINTIEFGDITFDSDEIYVTIKTTLESKFFSLALYTSDTEENQTIEINDLEFNNMLTEEHYYDIYTKNLDTGESISVNIFDQDGNNINSKFTIKISNIVNDYAVLYLKITGDITDIEYAKIKLEVDDNKTELIHYKNGTGIETDPYIIRTASELQLLESENSYFELGNDIDLTSEIESYYGWYHFDGYGWYPLDFTSHLDGKGYTIKNLTSQIGGLFYTMNNATLKNIKLENFDINDVGYYSDYTGSIAKEMNYNSQISNIYIDNLKINSSTLEVGGLVGLMNDGTIQDIHIKNSEISSDNNAGIITGTLTNPTNEITIKNVYAYNTKITGNTKGTIASTLSINDTSSNLKPIDLKYNIFQTENIDMIGKENITITDNDSYDVYSNVVTLDSNYLKTNSEVFTSETFDNYNMITTWSFDTTNSAYLKLFEDEYLVVNNSLVKFQTYKLQNNLIYKVPSETTTNSFVNDILNIGDISYSIYSKSNEQLQNEEYVTTGSYIDVTSGEDNQRYYIIVTGDTDGNGTSGAIDAYSIVLHTIEKKELTGRSLLAADYNEDGSVGARDAYAIVLDTLK